MRPKRGEGRVTHQTEKAKVAEGGESALEASDSHQKEGRTSADPRPLQCEAERADPEPK